MKIERILIITIRLGFTEKEIRGILKFDSYYNFQ